MGDIAHRVYARIGSSGSRDGDFLIQEGSQGILQTPLDAGCVVLHLPAAEGGSVIRECD